MASILPLDQLWFNIILRVLVTAYGISWIWNFLAFVPGYSKDDRNILWCTAKTNYSFRLISSLIFYLLWISQFQYAWLVYVTMGEIFIVIIFYVYFVARNYRRMKKTEKRIEELRKKKENLNKL